MPKPIPHHLTPYDELLKQVDEENKQIERQVVLNKIIDFIGKLKASQIDVLPKRIETEPEKDENGWRKSINMRQFSPFSPYKKTELIKHGGNI